jgi:ribose 5-phosphate isomerase A
MPDYKIEAARAASQLIKPHQTIGLGAGLTIAHLIDMVSIRKELIDTVAFVSSSFKTTNYLLTNGLKVQSPALVNNLDIYFDGCDQFDEELNALKSGGGIHTTEKILATMANEFILIGDDSKFSQQLDTVYPLVIEILPQALQIVLKRLADDYPAARISLRMSSQKDGAVISDNGNFLADIYFDKVINPEKLNTTIKMIPGIVDHSLFYRLASKAIVAGEHGTRVIYPND